MAESEPGPSAVEPEKLANELYFDTNYDLLATFDLLDGEKIRLGARQPRVCRYCGNGDSTVTFRKDAHAVPELVGNKKLFSNDECDQCNDHFSVYLEDHLAKYLTATRTISQIRGKKGVPTFKDVCGGARVEMTEAGLAYEVDGGKGTCTLDLDGKRIHLRAKRDPYVPMGVFKTFVKMALAILPIEEMADFEEARAWILLEEHTYESFPLKPLLALYSFTPGPMPYPGVHLRLWRRKADDLFVPYMIFAVAFGNNLFQIVVPSLKRDEAVLGRPFSLAYSPTVYDRFRPFGETVRGTVDLASPDVEVGDSVDITIRFESAEEVDPGDGEDHEGE